MLIIEGPDGVGKTTLCHKLLKHLPTHIYSHFSRLPKGFDFYWGYMERMSRNIVQDRFHLSEIIYATARGDITKLTPEIYRLVDGQLRRLGAYTVLVTAEEGLVDKRWHDSQMYDRAITQDAARLFCSLCTLFRDYQIDIDITVHCTVSNPYVTEDSISRILEEYQIRQSTVSNILSRKPSTF